MKRIIVAIAVFVTMSAISYSVNVSAGQHSTSGGRAEDEAAIHKVVGRLQDGWNKGDGKAFAAPFAEDADYVIVNGKRIKGREMIASGHQGIFDTVYKNSHNTGTIQSIRFVREDVAIVHSQWHLKFREGDTEREGTAMNTMVMTKEKGQWSIIAFHNTPIVQAEK
jgi:uncharacterized protein (TIGR02246 family)